MNHSCQRQTARTRVLHDDFAIQGAVLAVHIRKATDLPQAAHPGGSQAAAK
jgi:hypothetical protein